MKVSLLKSNIKNVTHTSCSWLKTRMFQMELSLYSSDWSCVNLEDTLWQPTSDTSAPQHITKSWHLTVHIHQDLLSLNTSVHQHPDYSVLLSTVVPLKRFHSPKKNKIKKKSTGRTQSSVDRWFSHFWIYLPAHPHTPLRQQIYCIPTLSTKTLTQTSDGAVTVLSGTGGCPIIRI